MIHLLPTSVLRALYSVLLWLRVAERTRVAIWAEIRCRELLAEVYRVEDLGDVVAFPCAGGDA